MKYLFIILALAASVTAASQSRPAILKKAQGLVESKKYESAFKELEKFDPDNTDIEVVLKKQDILLSYFVTSIMHQMFALKDLEPDEDIMDYRGSNGQFSMYSFPANEILDALIVKNPKDCRLYKGLADYYFDAHLRYGENWLKSEPELFSLIENNSNKAIAGGCADYMTHYMLGVMQLLNKRYAESIPHFLNSVKMNSGYATAHYNMAYAYLYADDTQNAIKHANIARDLYTGSSYKADAARLVATAYNELHDSTNALLNYELSNEIDPGNYYTLRPMLALYVESGNSKSAEALKVFYSLDPENPTIYSDLEQIYTGYGKTDELMSFYTKELDNAAGNDRVLGNLYFYMGALCIKNKKALAEQHLLKAREHFSKVFEPGHEVFSIIEEGLKSARE